ncbi:hypothetical protein KC367_g7677 [Hortaea werneckii]|nr:hypothetical protein KC342_g18437 [Hortaea werneckii]KAI7286733.1 hypothetical protein KC340_g18185 [Hortaea werneckii]KAI7369608.1 hypothetical protein KC328_g17931 [Hortaea werneckii]KAI7458657.1 hypothetical protein KC351_g18031 [Hortaea werneckii]KAI7459560.1 hypothetical protein KC357_g9146 [Hortaea werneckii]
MLRRLLARPQSLRDAIKRTSRPAAGPRPLRYQSTQPPPPPPSRPNQSHGVPPQPPNTHETRPQKLLRYLNPAAAPPLLARLPTLHLLTRICTLALGIFISAHIFMEYFYILTAAYGISMLPTIASNGDCLLISKYYRRGREVQVGDVVSYKLPLKPGENGVKRVVGLSGDFVEVKEAVVEEVEEEDGGRRKVVGSRPRCLQVPQGHCWVVGDNLAWSRDSRIFGPLPLALVTGKVIAKWSWSSWVPQWGRIEHGLKPAEEIDWEVD